MSYQEEMLNFNREFVRNHEYERYIATKYPDRKVAILTCMDTRLTELLPAALNLKNGDAKFIKNAGGVITHPFGSVMRSLIVCIYELGVEEIYVIGHFDCGMQHVQPDVMIQKMMERGITEEDLDMVRYFNIDMNLWLKGFEDPAESVRKTVGIIRKHPLIPQDVSCTGYLIDPENGRLEIVDC